MRFMLPVLLLVAVALPSCKDSGEPAATETAVVTPPAPTPAPAPESNMGKEGTAELMNTLAAYYTLKDALVATNGIMADEAAAKLMSAAELFHSGMLPEVPQRNELQEQLRVVMDGSEAIMATKAEAIEDKRAKFSDISEAIYKIAKISNLRNAGVYQQYCPMAFNDKGAYWLSAESEIRNPYFGKKMLICGEVKDSM